jgi:YD repeat-containing protein
MSHRQKRNILRGEHSNCICGKWSIREIGLRLTVPSAGSKLVATARRGTVMNRGELLLGMAALAVGSLSLNNLLIAQNFGIPDQSSDAIVTSKSDREKAELRGPVKTVTVESSTAQYDPAGRLISTRWRPTPDSEAAMTRTYDGSGRLLRVTLRNGDAPAVERVYFYDEKGRLLRIVDGSSGDRMSLEYDDRGRIVEISNVAHDSDGRQKSVAIGMGSMLEDTTVDVVVRELAETASKTKAIYDERDQPREIQAFDADGRLSGRMVLDHDEKGRIKHIKGVEDDPTLRIPADRQAEMAAESGVSPEEMKAYLKKVITATIGDETETGTSYSYDSKGRVREMIERGGGDDVKTTYTYNNHDDLVEERMTYSKKPSTIPTGVPFRLDENGKVVLEKPPSEWPAQPELPKPTVVHYEYQYDGYGNWTQRTDTRSGQETQTIRRELTYY